MTYRVRTTWIRGATPFGAECLRPAVAIPGVAFNSEAGVAVEGAELELLIDCDPSLLQAVLATGASITEEL